MPDLTCPTILTSGGRRTIGTETSASTPFFAFCFRHHLITVSSGEEQRTIGDRIEGSIVIQEPEQTPASLQKGRAFTTMSGARMCN